MNEKLAICLALGYGAVAGMLAWGSYDEGYKNGFEAGQKAGVQLCIDDLNAVRADYEAFKELATELKAGK